MKKALYLIITIFIITAATSCKKEKNLIKRNFNFTVATLIGDVSIESEKGSRKAKMGEIISIGETIITKKRSYADVMYGKRGIFRIYENSVINIFKINEKLKGDSQINLNKGKVYITIKKLLKDSKFKVKTPTSVASIRGTSFKVSTNETRALIEVISGTVKISPIKDKKIFDKVEQTVTKNQKIEIKTNQIDKITSQKIEIKVIDLKVIEIKEIKKEVSNIKKEVLAKLHKDTRSEFKIKILNKKKEEVEREEKKIEDFQYEDEVNIEDKSSIKKSENKPVKNDKALEKEKMEKDLKEKEGKRKTLARARAKAKKEKLAIETVAKEKAEQEKLLAEKKKADEERLKKLAAEKKKKEEKERAGNIPSL